MSANVFTLHSMVSNQRQRDAHWTQFVFIPKIPWPSLANNLAAGVGCRKVIV